VNAEADPQDDLRGSTRRVLLEALASARSETVDPFLWGYLGGAADWRPALDLRAVVLGVLDARRELKGVRG